MGKLAVPTVLAAILAGCASTSDIEDLQKQVNTVRATANSANATAQEAKAIATEARNTANVAVAASASAEKFSSEASGFAAAAVKGSEAAVGTAAQAQKAVSDATIAFPWMRLDPATGRFYYQWVVWPSVGEYLGTQPAPAADAPKP
jgi:hypothetical protein